MTLTDRPVVYIMPHVTDEEVEAMTAGRELMAARVVGGWGVLYAIERARPPSRWERGVADLVARLWNEPEEGT